MLLKNASIICAFYSGAVCCTLDPTHRRDDPDKRPNVRRYILLPNDVDERCLSAADGAKFASGDDAVSIVVVSLLV